MPNLRTFNVGRFRESLRPEEGAYNSQHGDIFSRIECKAARDTHYEIRNTTGLGNPT